MENSYLLDTHVIMQAFTNGLELPEAYYCMTDLSQQEVLAFPNMSDEQRASIDTIFEKMEILHVNESIVETAKSLKDKYELPNIDAVISATAYIYNLTLITNDSIFKKIEEINIEPFYFVQ